MYSGKTGGRGRALDEYTQAIEHHGVDGFPDREVPPGRVLMRDSVEDVAQAEFVEHARHKAEVVQHWATVWGLSAPHNLL